MTLRSTPALVFGLALMLAFGVASLLFPNPAFRTAMGDLLLFAVLSVTCVLCTRNAIDSRGHTRLFWTLISIGMVMWWSNQAGWTWFEVVIHRPIPDPYAGDVILFLHIVPLMGAVAIRPNDSDEEEGMLISALNVFILLSWWIVVYALFVFPEEFIATDPPVYALRWDFLYIVEGLLLIVVSAWAYFSSTGAWRRLYGSIAAASAIYTFASEEVNAAIARGTYHTGELYDIPLLAAFLGFFWIAWSGRQCLPETQVMPSIRKRRHAFASLLAQMALLSLPVIGYVALFVSRDAPYLRRFRFMAAMAGLAILALFVFLKQHLLDQRLRQLLDRSRESLENLQRLQGRVVQQAKLASLGELVALAASELEYPLSAILTDSANMAASVNLNREQLANAQKIGQQARRTHELVKDLLSFAQQTPGEKAPLEIKPLLQRALQMEAFKLSHRNITLTLDKIDSLPRVPGNSNQLLQAFVQIVENAVDALEEVGGGRLQVCAWREAEEVVIQFADSGPGLRVPERVFDPFYTTKPVGKGTGLGLSATYGVIQDHKGQITCSNRPEGGAVFEIRLPALKAAATTPNAAHV